MRSSEEAASKRGRSTRVERAARAAFMCTFTDIAGLLGFSSLGTFSRWFRGCFGTSPSTWRHQHTRPRPGAAPLAAPGSGGPPSRGNRAS
ncbi:helix-turn-helix domain-containing protein [Streptomyces sp. LMG1-1-1.1]|uniref:helix-turn-helix domain-containing protein n=1 Tax=Streptomyces sp. LMG1-1-1.1 TaxID=3135245 RepID=UPI003466023F